MSSWHACGYASVTQLRRRVREDGADKGALLSATKESGVVVCFESDSGSVERHGPIKSRPSGPADVGFESELGFEFDFILTQILLD